MAFCIVIPYNMPWLQIGSATLVQATYFVLDLIYSPFKNQSRNTKANIIGFLYLLSHFFFLGILVSQKSLEPSYQYYITGFGIILCLSLLLLYSLGIVLWDSGIALLKIIKTKSKTKPSKKFTDELNQKQKEKKDEIRIETNVQEKIPQDGVKRIKTNKYIRLNRVWIRRGNLGKKRFGPRNKNKNKMMEFSKKSKKNLTNKLK